MVADSDEGITHTVWLIPKLDCFEVWHLLLGYVRSFDGVRKIIELSIESWTSVNIKVRVDILGRYIPTVTTPSYDPAREKKEGPNVNDNGASMELATV
jgi:hypothetical protein